MRTALNDMTGKVKSDSQKIHLMASPKKQELISRLTDIISASSDIRGICDSFSGEVGELNWVDWVRVFLTSDEESGRSPGKSNRKQSPLANAPRHDIFVSARAVVENEPSRAICRQLQCPENTACIVWLPLVVGSDVVGVMVVANATPYSSSNRQLPALRYLAGMLSMAIRVKMLQQEKETAKQQDFEWFNFINLLVHELKTSLTTVVSSTGLLQEKTGKDSKVIRERIAQNLSESLSHLESAISELPTLMQARKQPAWVPADYCSAGLVLREALARMRPASERRKQILILDAKESLPQVAIGQNRLKQILLHLLSNAIESTPEKGEIILRAEASGESVIIQVADGGPVIPEEKHRELFEPSKWGEVDSQWIPRLRFRIAVSRILIEASAGKLWLDSQQQGNIFAFSLPAIDVSSLNHPAGR
jgi:K+-sensing histidine kinase KdpD